MPASASDAVAVSETATPRTRLPSAGVSSAADGAVTSRSTFTVAGAEGVPPTV